MASGFDSLTESGSGLATLGFLPFYVEAFVKSLAVIGGGAIGWFLVGFIVRRFGRWTTERAVPGRIVLLVRGLGAAAGGLAVWSMVYAPGGSGLFGGGGAITGGAGSGPGTEQTTVQPAPLTPQPAARPAEDRSPARVVLLGGPRVTDQRLYLLEGNPRPLTLAELKAILKERQQAGMTGLELLIYENSVARNHPAVRELEEWAAENNLTVSKPPTRGEIPMELR